MQRVLGRRESYAGFWWVNLREENCLGDPGVNGRIILRWIFWKWDVGGLHSVQNLLSSSLPSKNMNKIYRTIILRVVLYGCEIWPLTHREDRRQMVYESRVLRGIFGSKRYEVTGEWRKLC
jgi:hypothetical protein